mgnify:FL=1|jgi:hypothetical protein
MIPQAKSECINVEIRLNHYGFYSNDKCLGDVSKSYRDWVEKTTGKKWDDYSCGDWSTDIEMIDQWIVDTDQPYDTLWSETDDGIYLVDKQWSKKL